MDVVFKKRGEATMRTKTTVLAVLGSIGVAAGGAIARADIAPPPDYVESCTLEKTCPAGEECVLCPADYRDYSSTPVCEKNLESLSYVKKCKSYGASFWKEVWCRPATGSMDASVTILPIDASVGQTVRVLRCPSGVVDASVTTADAAPKDASAKQNKPDAAPKDASVSPNKPDEEVSPKDAAASSRADAAASKSKPTDENSSGDAKVTNPTGATEPKGSKSTSDSSCSALILGERTNNIIGLGLFISALTLVAIRRKR
jgi:hypothetical protein